MASEPQSTSGTDRRHRPGSRRVLGLAPQVWLLLPAGVILVTLFGLPLLWLARFSALPADAQGLWWEPVTLDHYARFLGDSFYLERVLWLTVRMALTASAIALLIGYPLAYWIAHQRSTKLKAVLLACVLGPLWLNTVIRVFGLMLLLNENGPINAMVVGLGLGEPLRLLYTETGVLIGLAHLGIPFVVISLLGVMENLDPRQREAAYLLGASPFYVFRRVIFPPTLPGVIGGFVLVFAIDASAFAIPGLLGGNRIPMLGLFIYQQAMVTGDLAFGSAMGLILLATTIVCLTLVTKVLHGVSQRV